MCKCLDWVFPSLPCRSDMHRLFLENVVASVEISFCLVVIIDQLFFFFVKDAGLPLTGAVGCAEAFHSSAFAWQTFWASYARRWCVFTSRLTRMVHNLLSEPEESFVGVCFAWRHQRFLWLNLFPFLLLCTYALRVLKQGFGSFLDEVRWWRVFMFWIASKLRGCNSRVGAERNVMMYFLLRSEGSCMASCKAPSPPVAFSFLKPFLFFWLAFPLNSLPFVFLLKWAW